MSGLIPTDYARLLGDIKQRIRSAQYEALKAVNRELIALYLGHREAARRVATGRDVGQVGRRTIGAGFTIRVSERRRLFRAKYLENAGFLPELSRKRKTDTIGGRNWLDAQSDYHGEVQG